MAERGYLEMPTKNLATLESGEKAGWMMVTPAVAERWLRVNGRNRPVRKDVVKAYARDMLNKVWAPTHQGVAFNDQNQLIDGQHRLHAIVLSGVTVRMMVTFGLPSKIEGKEMTTMDAVDRGATRSVADQLTIQHGMNNGSITASICAALASLCYGERTRRLSVGQTLEVFREFEPAVLYVIEHRTKQTGLRTTGVLAGFAFAMMSEWSGPVKERSKAAPNTRLKGEDGSTWSGPTKVGEMMAKMNSGEGLEKKSAIRKLREFLTSDEAKLFTRSLDRGLAELVLQAIWMESKGKPAEKLHAGVEGAEHFRSLQKSRVSKMAAIFKLKNERDLEKIGRDPV